MTQPLLVGLTGGVASGKSAVSASFAERGVPIIDADIVAREVVAPGQPALDDIIAEFGPGARTEAGGLDRRRLRELVFADPAKRRRLEEILHPRIRERMFSQALAVTEPYAIVVVPLLVENGLTDRFDRILVVDVPPAVQIERLCARDDITEETAQRMLDAQATREERLRAADDVIDNSKPLAMLPEQVERLHQRYLAIALSSRASDAP